MTGEPVIITNTGNDWGWPPTFDGTSAIGPVAAFVFAGDRVEGVFVSVGG